MKFIAELPKVIFENAIPQNPIIQLDEIDEMANSLNGHLDQELKVPKDVLDSFKLKDSLNPQIWENMKLHPKVRMQLLKIAKGFLNDIKLPKGSVIKDIIFTGSLANYNWSKFSDIDLHVVLDFQQFEGDPQMIEDYFTAQKTVWNNEHDITMFEYPVELYAQDTHAPLHATAVYSVTRDKWVKKPLREDFKLDKEAIKAKSEKFIKALKDIRDDYKNEDMGTVVSKAEKLKAKIKQMRKAGLESGGEYSLENLVFKVLRRTPFMELLNDLKAKAYDTLMSLNEVKYLPYDERPELRAASGSGSLSNPSYKLDLNKVKFRIAKAAEKAGMYKDETGDNTYFNLASEGDGFYQVEFRHDGQIKTKHIRASGDMEQRGGRFQPSDVGTCKQFQNIATYCFVKAGKNGGAVGASPAEDAADKALIIFRTEILDFLGAGTYYDEKNPEYAQSRMDDKTKVRKQKKDLEMKLNRRVTDAEFQNYLETGQEPKPKSGLTMSPEDKAKWEADQAEKIKRIEMLKAKMANRGKK